MALTAADITASSLSLVDAGFWAETNGILLDGRPFSFRDHEYQIEPMGCTAREECARKGAQIGWTSITALKTIHGLIFRRYPQGVLYLFPTKGDVIDFSKGRFTPLIEDNPVIAAHIKDTDAANIKRVGNAMLYFRGAKSSHKIQGSKSTSSALKSVPVDRLIFDEVDEMEPAMLDLALERVAHSDIKEVSYLSTPSIPDYGIDAKWQRSDQRVRQIRCRACGKNTCMEREFELNGWQKQRTLIRINGQVVRACVHCGAEIHPRDGKWAADYPGRDMVGWWISQLHSKYVSPLSILEAFEDPQRNTGETYNSKIGMPYIEARNRLSVEEVLALCSDAGVSSSDRGPCSMGVDQGKGLHVVVGKPDSTGKPRVVYLNELRDWEELDGLMKSFSITRCVVDALPETRNARSFADRHPGRVFLNYYVESQKGRPSWNEQQSTVTVNRTESLDNSHAQIQAAEIVLPKRCDVTEVFAKHCHNVAKRLEEDPESGSKRYVYVKLGPDHYRHAFNYECMARAHMVGNSFDVEGCFK